MADELEKIPDILGDKKESNWEDFKRELRSTKRDGVDDLLAYLETTDIVVAPASGRFHSSFPGGLVAHSLNVLEQARMLRLHLGLQVPEDSVIIASLLHDLCKVNYYEIGEVFYKENENSRWKKKQGYKIEEKAPLGHGEKSMMLAARHMQGCTVQELAAIRWHMGAWEHGVHSDHNVSKPFRQSLDNYPLVKLIMIADQLAELQEVTKPSEPVQGSIFPE